MKHIIIEACTKCPYSDLSSPKKDEVGNFICLKVKQEEYDYISSYDNKSGKFIITLKGVHNIEYAEMLDKYIPDWCPLEDCNSKIEVDKIIDELNKIGEINVVSYNDIKLAMEKVKTK